MNLNMQDKTIVVMGVANKRSIAWGIARSLHQAGAKLVFTYAGERFEKGLRDLVGTLEGAENSLLIECDVNSDEAIDHCFKIVKEHCRKIDGIAHCVAFAKREDLEGEYLSTTRENYLLAQSISSYSLTAVVKAARDILNEGASIITLTYLGGERVVQNYNVMGVAKASLEASVKYLASDLGPQGVRVNAISAGPIRTLSAKGVGDLNVMLQLMEERAPLRRASSAEEVGDTALFLFSHLSRGITGENLHVDSGFHTLSI